MTELPIDEMPTEEEIKEFEEMQAQFEDAHYLAIGKGITAWSRIEDILVVIVAILLDTRSKRPVSFSTRSTSSPGFPSSMSFSRCCGSRVLASAR